MFSCKSKWGPVMLGSLLSFCFMSRGSLPEFIIHLKLWLSLPSASHEMRVIEGDLKINCLAPMNCFADCGSIFIIIFELAKSPEGDFPIAYLHDTMVLWKQCYGIKSSATLFWKTHTSLHMMLSIMFSIVDTDSVGLHMGSCFQELNLLSSAGKASTVCSIAPFPIYFRPLGMWTSDSTGCTTHSHQVQLLGILLQTVLFDLTLMMENLVTCHCESWVDEAKANTNNQRPRAGAVAYLGHLADGTHKYFVTPYVKMI